jgi:hypothetical protein
LSILGRKERYLLLPLFLETGSGEYSEFLVGSFP